MRRLDLHQVLDRLEAAHDGLEPSLNPPKSVLKLGWPDRFANVMTAALPDGRFGTKTVYVDEATGATAGRVDLFSPDGKPLATGDAGVITPIRCALMAALAMRLRGREMTRSRVGIIGAGAIGTATAKVLHAMRDELLIDHILVKARAPIQANHEIVERFSASRFEGITITSLPGYVEECGTIVTCTNNQDQNALLRPEMFAQPPREMIAFDTGWMIGPEFWERGSGWRLFADAPDHLLAHARDEFPWDAHFASRLTMHPLKDIGYMASPQTLTLTILYGMAFADLIVLDAVAEACRVQPTSSIIDNLI